MLFPSATDSEKQQPAPNENNQMANSTSSPDVKSQQQRRRQRLLSNVPFRSIMKSMGRNRSRRVVRRFPRASTYQNSPLSRTTSAGDPEELPCNPRTETPPPSPPPEEKSSDAAEPKKVDKFFIRLRPKSGTKPADGVSAAADAGKQDSDAEAAEVPGLEPDNKKPKVHAGALVIGGPAAPPGTEVGAPSRPELSLPLNANDAKLAAAEKKVNEEEKEEENEREKEKGKEKEKVTKPKLSISLTPQEIDEDIFSLTGSRPSRKPNKRAKDVQKAHDKLFPGMYLCDVTPDSYKVQEPRIKG